MFTAVSEVATLRLVRMYGNSRSGGRFVPLHKQGTVSCVQRSLKKEMGTAIPKEQIEWAYDVLGSAMSSIGSAAHRSAN